MNEAYQLRFQHGLIAAWVLPWREYRAECARLGDEVPTLYTLAKMSATIGEHTKARELWAQGYRECARMGIAVEKYLHAHGRLPEQLDVLAPEYIAALPVGPFHGEPFSWTIEGSRGTIGFDVPDDLSPCTFTVLGPPDG
jgi:hypothetical protein